MLVSCYLSFEVDMKYYYRVFVENWTMTRILFYLYTGEYSSKFSLANNFPRRIILLGENFPRRMIFLAFNTKVRKDDKSDEIIKYLHSNNFL